jgi:hypothetical protein
VIYALFIIIVACQLYLGRISDDTFWQKYWLVILLVPCIAHHAWVEEELDKDE